MSEFKGIKSDWRVIENVVRADYIGASHKICEVNVKMNYPATEEHGHANLKLIKTAPKLLSAIEKALSISDLWMPADGNISEEFMNEMQALSSMCENFKEVVKLATE